MAEELLSSEDCFFLFDALDEVPDPSACTRLFDAVFDLMLRWIQDLASVRFLRGRTPSVRTVFPLISLSL